MVKLKGPALSLDALGSVGNTVTFSKWKGTNYLRKRSIPNNPQTAAQQAMRAMFRFLTQQWQSLAAPPQASWAQTALQLNLSPFNAYLRINQRNWRSFLFPGQFSTLERDDVPAGNALGVPDWEPPRIQINYATGPPNQGWAMCVFASTTLGFTPSPTNLILVEPQLGGGAHATYWTPPTVETWYLNIHNLAEEGGSTGPIGEQAAIP